MAYFFALGLSKSLGIPAFFWISILKGCHLKVLRRCPTEYGGQMGPERSHRDLGRDGAMGRHMLSCALEGQRTIYRNWFFPSTVWVLEIELRSSDFPVSAFIQ